MFPRKLLVLDVETTGLLPGRDTIIEIGACLLSEHDLVEKATFHSRVYTTSAISASALAAHGMSLADLKRAPEITEVVRKFSAFAPKDAIICGHNVGFDVAFLHAAYDQVGIAYDFDYHILDVWSIAFFVLGSRAVQLPKYNLTSLCSLFGIARNQKHNALQDARASAAILRHLVAVVQGSTLDVFGQFSMPVIGR